MIQLTLDQTQNKVEIKLWGPIGTVIGTAFWAALILGAQNSTSTEYLKVMLSICFSALLLLIGPLSDHGKKAEDGHQYSLTDCLRHGSPMVAVTVLSTLTAFAVYTTSMEVSILKGSALFVLGISVGFLYCRIRDRVRSL